MQEFKRSDIIFENNIIKLHHFHGPRNKNSVFVVPPHAGRHGNVVQNMVDALSADGRDTYAYELKGADFTNCNTSIGGLVNELNTCMNIIDNPVDMLGICQGGWLSSGYAASSLNQGRVKRLSLFAAPINTQTGEDNAIEDYCKEINIPLHKMIVAMHGGIQPGYMQWMAFAIANPLPVFMSRYFDLYNAIMANDIKAVEKWFKNNGWYDSPVDLAGDWFLDALENHFVKNKLFNGEWIINGETINLKNIDCDISVYSGADDDITHPEQARAVLDVVSSKNKRYTCFEGAGHTAVFVRPACIAKAMSDLYVG
jgi:poly(3-hydroxybutyrate) depolymerase